MTDTAPPLRPSPYAGGLGFALGAAALLLVLVQFWAGPFAPQQDAAVTIGEFAGEVRKAATRALLDQPQPAAQAVPWDVDRVLTLVAAVLAGGAVILGLAALVRHEPWRPAAGAVILGAGAVLFQFFAWTVLLVVGALIIVAILNNIGDILGG